ncbi:MAG: hypothetical protein Q9219_005817 [cf. Caloplaca sp. 3 TL-2023]
MLDMKEQNNGTVPAGADSTVDQSVPDPDEDDLDDLDELLDDFSHANQKKSKQGVPARPSSQDGSSSDYRSSNVEADNFERQLQEQMAMLMGNEDDSPRIRDEIQTILQELGTAVGSAPPHQPLPSAQTTEFPSASPDESFQEAIRRTLERMQVSGDHASAAAAADQSSEHDFARILEETHAYDRGGAAGDEEFSRMLMMMMEQLTNKDILYDPMKELNDKFPSWFLMNKGGVSAEDQLRYEKQQRLIAEIVGKFEESTYSDSNKKDREYIVERMQEVVHELQNVLTRS